MSRDDDLAEKERTKFEVFKANTRYKEDVTYKLGGLNMFSDFPVPKLDIWIL
jgi:hypothetical protein